MNQTWEIAKDLILDPDLAWLAQILTQPPSPPIFFEGFISTSI